MILIMVMIWRHKRLIDFFLLRNAEDHAENCLLLLQLVSSSGDNCEGDDGDDDGDDGDDDDGDDNDADIGGDNDDDDDGGGT